MCDKHNKFVQLHLHTDASLLDGATNYKQVIKQAKDLSCPAIAITDHGNPCRLLDFYRECKKNEIKPILGLEFYITNDLRSRKPRGERTDVNERDYHQSVYIKNKEGYKNFNNLTYISQTEGYYYKPRIDFDVLFEKKNGLMITSSCMASKIGNLIVAGEERQAEEMFKRYVLEFGEDFYGEIQFNEIPNQKEINNLIIHLSNKYNVPVIIGGDVHYNKPEDNLFQDAIIRSKRDNEAQDWVIDARHLYFHDTNDYYKLNKDFGYNYDKKFLEDCFENSVKFSEKVNFDFQFGTYHLPKIDTGGLSSKEYIERKAWEGIGKNIQEARKYFPTKFSNEEISKIEEQVKYELKVIDDLGLNDYLLIVHDIIKWEKENGIYVGPGRGSAAASTVAWGLGITGLNPLEFGLIFERFINPERKVMADIDFDSEQGARDKILDYLIGKYGAESVCNVATFGTYKVKSALQAMSRGLKKDTSLSSVLMKKITKLAEIEDDRKQWKEGEVVEYFKDVRSKTTDADIIAWIDDNQEVIKYADKIQGQISNLGTHAGGIVVTPGPIYDFIPVTRGSGNLVTAFRESDGSSKDLSDLGILKLDVLGLRTLNLLRECVERIKKDKGIDLSEKIYHLDLNDKKLLDYFGTGNNFGIFQMDRSKMFTDRIKVDSFNDIVAINAMNRPGPLEKFLDKYGYWKAIDKGEIKVTKEELEKIDKERYPFSFMRNVLSETYGCLLYQEQFMKLVCEVSEFSFGEADSFRRAIAWKTDHPKYYTVKGYFDRLEKGMLDKGYTTKDVQDFLEYCRAFMGYSFNSAHATTYGYIAYQTLFFKVYYPAYFYSAMINIASDKDEMLLIIADAKKNGVQIEPPSIEKSDYTAKATEDFKVNLGFNTVKGMGSSAEAIFKNSNGNNLTLVEALQLPLNKTQIRNLISIGSYDSYNVDRGHLLKLLELFEDKKIETWFTRKRNPLRLETAPETLKGLFEMTKVLEYALKVASEKEPHKLLVEKLISELSLPILEPERYRQETLDSQIELLGFSLVKSKEKEYEGTLKMKGIESIKDYNSHNPDGLYYFVPEKVEVKLTKTGKEYLHLIFEGGIKCKCWKKLDISVGRVYYARFKKDMYGFTLNDGTLVNI